MQEIEPEVSPHFAFQSVLTSDPLDPEAGHIND